MSLGVTIPFGVPLADHPGVVERLLGCGYTDLWTAETTRTDAFTPPSAAAGWSGDARLGTAIASVSGRGPAPLAMAIAGLCELAPGRVAAGLAPSSASMIEGGQDRTFDRPAQRAVHTVRFLRLGLAGEVLRSSSAAAEAPAGCRANAGASLVEALAALHAADVEALGLGHLRRSAPHIVRQLGRWKKQWDATTEVPHPLMDDIHRHVVAQVPEGRREVLVHSDPKLDNCILDEHGRLRALLDWALSAVGEPLADLAMVLAMWTEPGDGEVALQDPPTGAGGFAPRAELVDGYGAAGGMVDTDALAYYLTFSYWKLAGIVQGVRFRLERAAMGVDAPDPAPFAAQVERLARLADGSRARAGA